MDKEKNRKTEFTEEAEETETIFRDSASANECTGLIQGMPIDESDKESYGEIFDYGSETHSHEIHAGEVSEPHQRRGMSRGDPAGTSKE